MSTDQDIQFVGARTPKELALTKGQTRALEFFDLDLIGEAEFDNDFTVRDFIDGVIADTKDSDARVRIAARRFFWQMKKDVATMSGHIGKAVSQKETDAAGNTTQKTTISAQVIVNRIKGTNPHDRPQPVGQHTVLTPNSGFNHEDPEIDRPLNLPKGLPDSQSARLGDSDPEGGPLAPGLLDPGRDSLGEGRSEQPSPSDNGGAVPAGNEVQDSGAGVHPQS